MYSKSMRLFIGGKWIDSGQKLEVVDPYTKQILASVALADARLIDDAIAAAHAAFAQTRRLARFERAELLRAVSLGIDRRRDDFARTIVGEAAKPITLAEAEVTRAITTFRVAAEEARRFGDESIEVDAYPAGGGHFGIMRRFPMGVIYGMTPFNFPLNLVAHKVAPALASGNTIVIKPSPRTPLSALMLGEVIEESGGPPGAVNVIVAPNDLATHPLTDERVKHVSFTGSVPVGWSIKQQAATKKVTLEMGGNAGVIVHEDADLPAAIPLIATGGFAYAGQSCISVQRIFIHAPVYERFRDRFVDHVRKSVPVGDPRDPRTLVGPLIDDASMQRVRVLLDDATAAGARILCGGKFSDRVLEPTVLENVKSELDICAKEVFAPIVTLHSYESFTKALAMVNDSIYGLQAGVFTRDMTRAREAFKELEVGGVMVNQVPTFRVENMPYGGVKASGFGREGVRWAMEEMTEIRVLISRNLNT